MAHVGMYTCLYNRFTQDALNRRSRVSVDTRVSVDSKSSRTNMHACKRNLKHVRIDGVNELVVAGEVTEHLVAYLVTSFLLEIQQCLVGIVLNAVSWI